MKSFFLYCIVAISLVTITTVQSYAQCEGVPGAPIASNSGAVCQGNPATLTVSGMAPGGYVATFAGYQYFFVDQVIPESNFTIEMWVNPAYESGSIFSAGDNTNQNFDRNIFLVNNELYTRLQSSGDVWATGITINNGQWHHIAWVVATGVGQQIYLDGNLVASDDEYDHSDLDTQTYFILAAGNSDPFYPYTFVGKLDNLRIWSEARTQTDIHNNMTLETPADTTNLIYECPLNGSANAAIGNNASTSNVSYAYQDYYTYTWTGAGAPSPSMDETQFTSALSTSGTYSVTASAAGCASPGSSTDVVVNPILNYYPDKDGDGYGSSTDSAIAACPSPGPGYVTNNKDCDDANASVHPSGDPTIFGDNVWNLYVWNAGDGAFDNLAWSQNYSGYYVNGAFSFTTGWGFSNPPSNASGYQGCPVGTFHNSWSAKRKGFPCGNYQINLPYFGGAMQLLVNGVEIWQITNSLGPANDVWTGYLNDSSTIEFRATTGNQYTYGSISFIALDSILPTGPIVLCPGSSVELSATTADSYLWSTGETTQSISVTSTGTYSITSTSNGCSQNRSVSVIPGISTAPIASNNSPFCGASPVTLTASGLAPRGRAANCNSGLGITVFQDIPQSNITIEMWVKSDNGSGGGLFEAQRNTGEQGISGQMYLSGGTVVLNLTASEGGWSTGVYLNSGEWHHLAWVIESGVGEKLYLDGSLAATNTPDHFDLDPTLFILGTKNISNYFSGDIDNVRIWNEARTQSEILNNMSLETPADTSDLIYECTLNGNANATIGSNPGNVGILSYDPVQYYTYTWTGTGAPPPSTSETQTTSALTSGGTYYVTASVGTCTSPSASTDVVVNPLVSYYPDNDGDGYGSSTALPITSCSNPGTGYVTNNTDCNDANSSIHPNQPDLCNGIDDNCNGQIDEDAQHTTYYVDADNDGYGSSSDPGSSLCYDPGAGYSTNNTDCNDANSSIHPNQPDLCNGIDDNCNSQIDEDAIFTLYYVDSDHDGYGSSSDPGTLFCSDPGTGYSTNNTDCNDTNAAVHPATCEIEGNGIDDNCNGQIDEDNQLGDPSVFGDHVWNQYVWNSVNWTDNYIGYDVFTDLNYNSQTDWIPSSNPTTSTTYHGCSLQSNDYFSWSCKRKGFDYGIYSISVPEHDDYAELYVNGEFIWAAGCCGSDQEIWNGLLTDSSTIEFRVEENTGDAYGHIEITQVCVPGTYYGDEDGDGYGNPALVWNVCTPFPGLVTNNTDCDDLNPAVHPGATEICNGIDDNCNGQIDEGVTTIFYADADGDGYGNPLLTVVDCTPPPGYVSDSTDCNDANSAIHPGATDICNGIDDNCNGVIDENAVDATISPSGTISNCGNLTLTANTAGGYSYQWYNNGKAIKNATSSTYVAKKSGSYSVYETNGICNATSAATVVTVNPVPKATITPLGSLDLCGTGSVVLQAGSGSNYSYQWQKGKNNISGATKQNYTATKQGTYYVTVTLNGACSAKSKGVKVTKSCRESSAGDELISTTVNVYPNPTNGKFILNLNLNEQVNGKATVIITNSIGQIAYHSEEGIADGLLSKEINLSNADGTGLYVVRIIYGDRLFIKQLILQR